MKAVRWFIRSPSSVYGRKSITDAKSLPSNIDLAVILVPSRMVTEIMEVCGRTGIRHAVISTGVTLGIMSFMGEVMLMGIVVNNANVLLDYIHLAA